MKRLLLLLLFTPAMLFSGTIITPIDSLQNISIENGSSVKYFISHLNWVLCIDSAGNTWGYEYGDEKIGKSQVFSNKLEFFKEVRSIVSIVSAVVVIYTDGTTQKFSVENLEWKMEIPLNGEPIATIGDSSLYLIGSPGLISIVNTKGEFWSHLISKSVGVATKTLGLAVAVSGTPSVDVILLDGKIMVLNEMGEIWQHEIRTIVTPQQNLGFILYATKVEGNNLSGAKKLIAINSTTLVTLNSNGTMSFLNLI